MRRLRRARGGIAAVEFALCAGFLVFAFTALYDFGRASWRRMEVASAAQAGAVYAASYGFNTTGIAAVVQTATGASGITATPAPAMTCGCPAGVGGITSAACGSTCPSVNGAPAVQAGYYITVNARSTYSFLFPYPFVQSPVTISSTVVAKLQ